MKKEILSKNALLVIGAVMLAAVISYNVFLTPHESPAKVTYTSESSEILEEKVKININKATLEELETLTGIGPVTAEKILEYREKVGIIRSADELLEIEGIGEKKLAAFEDEIVFN